MTRSIPVPTDLDSKTKKIISRKYTPSVKIRAIALELHSSFLQPIDDYFALLSEVVYHDC